MNRLFRPTVIFMVIAGFYIQAETLWDFPGKMDIWYSYSDASSGGNSESSEFKVGDSTVIWSFQLKRNDNNVWPFAGISRTISNSERKNIRKSDSLIVEIRSQQPIPLNIRLSTFDPEITKPEIFQSWRTLEYQVVIKDKKQRISIPLKDFRVSEWWKKKYRIASSDNRLFLESIGRIDLTANRPQYCHQAQTVKIYSLTVKHKSRSPVLLISLTLTFLLSGLITLRFFKKNNKLDKPQTGIIQINPHPVSEQLSEWDRVLQYLQNSYSDPQLNLQQVGAALGMSDSKLSRIVNERYPDGFRCLVHEFRIKESKRLLKESEMNISEIAFKLGYATPNHFNREFKKRTQVSPRIYRKRV